MYGFAICMAFTSPNTQSGTVQRPVVTIMSTMKSEVWDRSSHLHLSLKVEIDKGLGAVKPFKFLREPFQRGILTTACF
jgi:hypothetical protein